MNFTMNSAAYANAERTAAIVQTKEAGAIAISQQDAPDIWAAMLQKGGIAPYVAPPSDVRKVPKSLVVARLIEAGKINIAVQTILSESGLFARWTAPDKGFVNSNDPDTISFLQAIGADPTAILAE